MAETSLISGRSRGYVETGLAGLINGSIGVMVSYATAPTSMMIVLRTVFAALALGGVVIWLGGWRDLRRQGVALKVLGSGVCLAAHMLLYFLSIRLNGVSIAIFLAYLAPVYLAFVAPRIFHQSTERIVYAALAVGVGGMALILAPALAASGSAHLTAAGLCCGLASAAVYAGYLLSGKLLCNADVGSTTMVFSQCVIVTIVLLPLALAQTWGSYSLTGRDVLMGLLLGVLGMALTFSLLMHGMKYIRVQHSSIIGYLEPVSAPFYALLFLGQSLSGWTVAGGVLIIAAGILVVVFGRDDEKEPAAAALPAWEPALGGEPAGGCPSAQDTAGRCPDGREGSLAGEARA